MFDHVEKNKIFQAIENRGEILPYVYPYIFAFAIGVAFVHLVILMGRWVVTRNYTTVEGKITELNNPWWIGLPFFAKPKYRKIKVAYEYVVHGVRYRGYRVSVSLGYQEKIHTDLSLAFEAGRDIKILIDPQRPENSILDNKIRFLEVFIAVVLGALSFLALISKVPILSILGYPEAH